MTLERTYGDDLYNIQGAEKSGIKKRFHRSINTTWLVRNFRAVERQLQCCKGTEHHRLIQITHVPDPENAAIQRPEPAAQCQIVSALR